MPHAATRDTPDGWSPLYYTSAGLEAMSVRGEHCLTAYHEHGQWWAHIVHPEAPRGSRVLACDQRLHPTAEAAARAVWALYEARG